MYENLDIFYFSSTHWDREWYQPFQGFRYRLVQFVNKLIDLYKDFSDIIIDNNGKIEDTVSQIINCFIQNKKTVFDVTPKS